MLFIIFEFALRGLLLLLLLFKTIRLLLSENEMMFVVSESWRQIKFVLGDDVKMLEVLFFSFKVVVLDDKSSPLLNKLLLIVNLF